MAIWAAAGPDHDFAIQAWSPGAEEMYGISRDDALGKNYIDLFVNELERTQAIADHIEVATTQEMYRNLARDKIAGKDAVILTMGFGLWHPELEEYMQAEIAVDVTDVPGEGSDWLAKVRQLAFQERELAARTRLLEQLNNSTMAVGSLTDESTLAEVLKIVFESARDLIPEIQRLRVWYHGSDDEQVVLPSSDMPFVEHEYNEIEVRDWALRAKREVRIDYQSYPPPREQHESRVGLRFPRARHTSRSLSKSPFCVIPLLIREQAVGVCIAYFREDFEFSREEVVSALRSFVLQAAYAVAEAVRVRADREKNKLIAEQQERLTRARISAEYTHAMAKRADALRWICELLREKVPSLQKDPMELERYLALIESVSEAITASAEGLEKAVEPSTFDLAGVIEGLVNRFSLQYPDVDVSPHLWVGSLVRGVRVFIEGAFENLFFNSIEALNGRGRVLASMSQLARTRTRPPVVEVLICDDGPGLPSSLETLCAPGESTKGAGHGFGLTRAKQVFSEAGGAFDEVKVLGWPGACLKVTLPLTDR